jgi:menaquinone-dependent protoporphyrinogen oxidase
MWMTKGPTDPTAVVEFTDWNRVEAFGAQLATMAGTARDSAPLAG